MRLRDVGRIELGSRSYTSTAKLNNQDTAFLVIYQLPDANALEVAERVKALVDEASASFPEGVNHTVLYDTTEFISRSISEVIVTLFQAVGLVILVVFLFLQNWRATLIPSIAIPVSLIGTFAVMSVLGYSINTITLFGLVLAIGIVVDDAIVVIENVERILAEEKLPIREAVTKAMAEVTGPVIATTLVLLAVFVPVAFMPGITGKLYQQFSVTISVAVIISSINALTLSPALCVALLGRSGDKAIGWLRPFEVLITRTTSGYSKLVVQLLRKGALVGVALVVILVAGAGLFKSVPSAFVPPEDQGFLFVDVQLPDAASLERTEAVLTKVTDMVLEDPAVTDFITVSGFSLLGGASSNNGLGIVMLKDWEEREDASLGLGAVIPRLYSRLWTIPEAQVMVFNPPPIPGLGTSSGFDFRLQDNQGRDVSELAQVMNGLIYEANQREELSRVYSTYRANIPQYLLEVERNKAKALGIELSDIFSTLQTQLGSLYVNDFTRFGKNYRVLLQAEGEFRQRPEDLSHYFVRNRDGDMVPLTTRASLQPVLGPSSIQHFNLKRSVTISGEAAAGFASGAGAASRVSLGITVLSGMVAATVLGTLLVPVFYKWIQSVRDRRQPAA